tara:strand:- start:2829 stop:3185 length:357 start_codon:yes stop_codon:yes gene_type:complete
MAEGSGRRASPAEDKPLVGSDGVIAHIDGINPDRIVRSKPFNRTAKPAENVRKRVGLGAGLHEIRFSQIIQAAPFRRDFFLGNKCLFRVLHQNPADLAGFILHAIVSSSLNKLFFNFK